MKSLFNDLLKKKVKDTQSIDDEYQLTSEELQIIDEYIKSSSSRNLGKKLDKKTKVVRVKNRLNRINSNLDDYEDILNIPTYFGDKENNNG